MKSLRTVLAAHEATVPLTAPGVLFGETLFETVRGRRGRFFRLTEHVERMKKGLEALQWGTLAPAPVLREGLRAVLQRAELATVEDVRVRITAVRMDEAGNLDYFIQAMPYTPPSDELYATGVDAVVASPRIDPRAPWTDYKTGHRWPHRLAKAEAERAGVWEALLRNTEGMLIDGTITNVHFVTEGRVVTPQKGSGTLPGVTQRAVWDIARSMSIPWEFGHCPLTVLKEASEAFLTNALIGLVPLVRVDGAPIGSGEPGPVTRHLAAAYRQAVAEQSRPLDA